MADQSSSSQSKIENYYEILSVSHNATKSEIKEAWRRKALELHPDKNGFDTTNAFKKLFEAYSVLRDARNRDIYDSQLKSASKPLACKLPCKMKAPVCKKHDLDVIIEWRDSETEGEDIDYYILEMKREGDLVQEVYEGESRRIIVSGLVCDWIYQFRVRAVNSLGAGEFSDFSSCITPEYIPHHVDTQETIEENTKPQFVEKSLQLDSEPSISSNSSLTSTNISSNIDRNNLDDYKKQEMQFFDSLPSINIDHFKVTKTQELVQRLHFATSTRNLDMLEAILEDANRFEHFTSKKSPFSSLFKLAMKTFMQIHTTSKMGHPNYDWQHQTMVPMTNLILHENLIPNSHYHNHPSNTFINHADISGIPNDNQNGHVGNPENQSKNSNENLIFPIKTPKSLL